MEEFLKNKVVANDDINEQISRLSKDLNFPFTKEKLHKAIDQSLEMANYKAGTIYFNKEVAYSIFNGNIYDNSISNESRKIFFKLIKQILKEKEEEKKKIYKTCVREYDQEAKKCGFKSWKELDDHLNNLDKD